MDKKRKGCICAGLACILSVTAACSPAQIPCRDADLRPITEAIAASVTPDGKVVPPRYAASIWLYFQMQDTGYSCLTAGVTDPQKEQLPYEQIRARFRTLTREDLISDGNQALESVYFYWEAADWIGFEIEPELREELLTYVRDLYCEDGYFYPSRGEKYGSYEVDLLSTEAQQCVLYATAILGDALGEAEQTAILQTFYGAMDRLGGLAYSVQDAAAVTTYLELSRRFGGSPADHDTAALLDYCREYLSLILQGETKEVDIATLNQLVKGLGAADVDAQTRQLLADKIEEYRDPGEDGGYGIFPHEEGTAIVSTWFALELLTLLELPVPQETCRQINCYMSRYLLYTGLFLYSDFQPDLSETVFSWKILNEYGDDRETQQRLEEALDRAYQDMDRENRDLSTLHLIWYGVDRGLPAELAWPLWDSFFETKSAASDYSDLGWEVLYYILHLINETGYEIPAKQRELLCAYHMERADALSRESTGDTQSVSAAVFARTFLYLNLLELGFPAEQTEVCGLVDLFAAEYPNLTQRLSQTWWIVTLMQAYGVSRDRIEAVRSSIDADIEGSAYFGVSFFSEGWPSFEATYDVLRIQAYLCPEG